MISSTDFQEAVIKYLEKYDIYPFSVTYTSDYNRSSDGCILGITTFIVDDIDYNPRTSWIIRACVIRAGFTVFRR